MVAVLLLLSGLAAIGLSVADPPAPTLAFATPRQILQATLAAARRSGAFQVVASGAAVGPGGDAAIGTSATFDAGPDGVLVSGHSSGHTVSLVVKDGAAYVRAGGTLWTAVFGSDARAATYDGQWIETPWSTPAYEPLTRFASAAAIVSDLLDLTGPLTILRTAGVRGTVAIQGSIPATTFNEGAGAGDRATLVVSASPPFLPVSVTFSDQIGGLGTYLFSRWGQSPTIPSTSGALPVEAVPGAVTLVPSWPQPAEVCPAATGTSAGGDTYCVDVVAGVTGAP